MSNYYRAIIDAKKTRDLKSFLSEIGSAFRFPEYYGKNMNALAECLNDLSWLKENNYLLQIKNSEHFLADEDESTRKSIIDFLNKVRQEWASVPNYPGEEQYRAKANFDIRFE